ncbi:hypothetical protein GC101_20060 [Paenibacillus sp. LMG 31459]|uniref:PIN domain-containing protein n=1 Tax=Paenibacillus phytohabitans TaxID=2654978 RepID=A0ABX1YK06_9BACL|nr:hypothetical protein [Paenibacillus phytohabitans]NOU81161.1 hypothetical protein [Paenibacillus phytohabitans]
MMKTKIVIWDGCILADRFIYRNQKVRKEFDRLYDLHLNSFIEFCLPKAVQAEFYGLLRSGGIAIRKVKDGPMMPVAFEHDKLMSLFKLFDGIFNVEFLDSLAHIDWPEFSDDYKRIVEQIMQEEYGWSNKGQDVIEEYLGKTITALQEEAKKKRGRKKPLKDTDDYPVMAAAIIHNADIIVTYNLKDFIDPFGRIRVMNLDMFLSQPIQDSLF